MTIPGIWGGGTPKPFKYTEIQRHRFNLADREGVADRKVPLQPLVFTSADGSMKRYNLRKVTRSVFREANRHCCNVRKILFENVIIS